jgi:hypothetical protein
VRVKQGQPTPAPQCLQGVEKTCPQVTLRPRGFLAASGPSRLSPYFGGLLVMRARASGFIVKASASVIVGAERAIPVLPQLPPKRRPLFGCLRVCRAEGYVKLFQVMQRQL